MKHHICEVCGRPIITTGKRGPAARKHPECKDFTDFLSGAVRALEDIRFHPDAVFIGDSGRPKNGDIARNARAIFTAFLNVSFKNIQTHDGPESFRVASGKRRARRKSTGTCLVCGRPVVKPARGPAPAMHRECADFDHFAAAMSRASQQIRFHPDQVADRVKGIRSQVFVHINQHLQPFQIARKTYDGPESFALTKEEKKAGTTKAEKAAGILQK